MPASYIVSQPATQAGTSSQEEYDETESEEDRVMTSSTEQVHPAASLPRHPTVVRPGLVAAALDSDDDSDDENATALGRPSSSPTTFRPQPNAFSHPPSHMTHRHSTSSAHPYHSTGSRPSMPSRSHTRSHSHRNVPNFMSPSYQADNDAALRASLTTLLSCAAAARGLPKKENAPRSNPGVVPSSQPMGLRLVPEAELMAEAPPVPGVATGHNPVKLPPMRTASNSSAPSAPSSSSSREPTQQTLATAEKSKRTAATQSKHPRVTKKKRTGSSTGLVDSESGSLISPTMLTWVVSAGVLVLVSVVGFGAGYVIGREVGRQEGSMSLSEVMSASNASSTNCGRELVKSTSGGTLRRFRWGSVGKTITA